MAEIRVCIADLDNWYSNSLDIDNIIECAESQGTVMTLNTFCKQFNNGELTELLNKENTVIGYYESEI